MGRPFYIAYPDTSYLNNSDFVNDPRSCIIEFYAWYDKDSSH